MEPGFLMSRGARFAAAIVVALTLGACASKTNDADTLGQGGPQTPGSIQDFVVSRPT